MTSQINDCRKLIDTIDETIILSLAERLRLVDRIGELKRSAGQIVEDKERELEMREERKRLAEELKISTSVVENIFTVILAESKKRQALKPTP